MPERVRARISGVVEPLVGQRGLRIGQIERRLLIAGDTPGVALRSALAPGAETGATVLVVEAKHRPISGFATFDNTLANVLGRINVGVGFDANSVFGFGETVYARAYGHPSGAEGNGLGGLFDDRPRVRTLAAGVIIPIGTDGLTLNLEGTESRTTPKAAGGVQTASEFDRYSARLRYPWIRSRMFNLASEVILDAQEERLSLLLPGIDLPLSLDRLRILRFASDASSRLDSRGVLSGRAIGSFGLDALGARSQADATPLLPLSRAGADADFQKFEVLVSFQQPVVEHLAVSLYGRAQTSFGQALPRSEQIGIASLNELSTFDAGTLGGDSGWIVRGELLSPWSVAAGSLPLSIVPYLFAATGALYLEQPTILEQSTLRVSSVGVGVRLGAVLEPGFSDASLTLEFGRKLRDDDLPDDNRFTIVGAVRF